MKDYLIHFLGTWAFFGIFISPNLQANPIDSCVISNVFTQIQPCNNNLFYADLFFTATNPGDSGFIVTGNGTNYGIFDYGQAYYTFGPFPGDGSTAWEFIVTDTEFSDCKGFTDLGIINCNPNPDPDTCKIFDLVVSPQQCTSDSTFNLAIDFQAQDTSGFGFDVFADGQFFGSYSYNNLPLAIDYFPATGNNNTALKVCDRNDLNCCSTVFFNSPSCAPVCQLDSIQANAVECLEAGIYSLQLMIYQNGYTTADTFDLFATGTYLGSFPFGQSTLLLDSFPGSGQLEDQITLCHSSLPDCCLNTSFEALICDDLCRIANVELTASDCENGEFYIALDLEYVNPGFLGFQVLGNGRNYGIFHYPDLPIDLGPFSGTEQIVREFIVLDQIDQNCANIGLLDPILCTPSSSPNLMENAIDFSLHVSLLYLNFNQALQQEARVFLYNNTGQILIQQNIPKARNHSEINLSGLSRGIYFMEIWMGNQRVTRRFFY